MSERVAHIARTTKETDIDLSVGLDGTGKTDVETGIGFFDHMLTAFGRHGLFDLQVRCKGDLEVDGHHSVEDTGIVMGQAFAQALGDKRGIRRFGDIAMPMDEALIMAEHAPRHRGHVQGGGARHAPGLRARPPHGRRAAVHEGDAVAAHACLTAAA